MSNNKSLLYILPTGKAHVGIFNKVEGQLKALSHLYNTSFIYYDYKKSDFLLIKVIKNIVFSIKSLFLVLFFSEIYYRYNPKAIFINLLLLPVSLFKSIKIEHNTFYEYELSFLGRKKELLLHMVTQYLFKYFPMQHTVVHKELISYLVNKDIPSKNITFFQNGYLNTIFDKEKVDRCIIEYIKNLKNDQNRVAVFVGNGYDWHGLDRIVTLFKDVNCVELIVVGPYEKNSTFSNIHFLGKVTIETLKESYKYVDFGVGPFAWDRINISEGCPLKTREYLFHGLPILVNYTDWAIEDEDLRPYVFNLKKEPKSFEKLLKLSSSKEDISANARRAFDWKVCFVDILFK